MITGRIVKLMAPVLVVAGVVIAGPAALAAAHTCGTQVCSGTDGANATVNIQGNAPMIYIGEVGIYYMDVPGGGGTRTCPSDGFTTGACFTSTAATKANTRKNNGTGLGVWDYYFGGGGTSSYEGEFASPYCFGWNQGYYATERFMSHVSKTYISWVMELDIEGGTTFGWKANEDVPLGVELG